MRIARIIASVVFASALVFILCINSFATSASTQPLDIYMVEAEYRGGNFVYFEPTVITDDSVSFRDIPNTFNEDDTLLLSSLTLMGYGMNEFIDFQHGYIYTFNYHVRISGVDGNSVNPTVSLGIAETDFDGMIAKSIPIGDVTYQKIVVNNRITDYVCTSVVYVDETFNNAGIDIEGASVILSFSNMFLVSAPTINIISSDMTVEKAVGEDAYYQASLDAINQLPNEIVENEYSFVINRMPDEDALIEQINGDYDDILVETKNELNGMNTLLDSFDVVEPRIYMPNINIPMGDGVNINLSNTKYGEYVGSDGYFRPLSMLHSMNPNIITWINTFLMFIRTVACFAFLTFGLFKMTRYEWWIN